MVFRFGVNNWGIHNRVYPETVAKYANHFATDLDSFFNQ
ncbi:Uncharacterised protein [Streptococcus pneumoniae]|nr:Uncharacterised protein [Streptococcus pneumoniae]